MLLDKIVSPCNIFCLDKEITTKCTHGRINWCVRHTLPSAAILPRRGMLLHCLCPSAAGLLACVDSVFSQRGALLLFGVLINSTFLKLQFVELVKLWLILVLQLGSGYTSIWLQRDSAILLYHLLVCISLLQMLTIVFKSWWTLNNCDLDCLQISPDNCK